MLIRASKSDESGRRHASTTARSCARIMAACAAFRVDTISNPNARDKPRLSHIASRSAVTRAPPLVAAGPPFLASSPSLA